MEKRICKLCGKPLMTDRGMICWDCVRKHQQRKQQRHFFGMRVEMTREQIDKEIYFAESIIGAIHHVDAPVLRYQEEKDVVKKALNKYVEELKSELRGK